MSDQTAVVDVTPEQAQVAAVSPTASRVARPAEAAPHKRRRRRRDVWLKAGGVIGAHVVFVVAIVALWAYAARHWLDPLILPSPGSVWSSLWNWIETGYIFEQTWYTLQSMLIGFAIGSAAAVVLAVALTNVLWLGRFIEPYIIAFDAIPLIAIVPILIAWFGFGYEAKTAMAIFAAFVIVFINSFRGLRNTEPKYLELARLLQANRRQKLVKFRLWAAVPFFASAVKLALPRTAFAVVVTEFLGSNQGLGYVIVRAQSLLNIPNLIAAVVALTVVVQVLSRLAALLERLALAWVPKEKR